MRATIADYARVLPYEVMEVGERFRKLRDERGWTRQQLAAVAAANGDFVSPDYLGRIERGAKHPHQETIEILARTLGVRHEEIPDWEIAEERRRLNPRAVGREAALKRLASIRRAEALARLAEEAGLALPEPI